MFLAITVQFSFGWRRSTAVRTLKVIFIGFCRWCLVSSIQADFEPLSPSHRKQISRLRYICVSHKRHIVTFLPWSTYMASSIQANWFTWDEFLLQMTVHWKYNSFCTFFYHHWSSCILSGDLDYSAILTFFINQSVPPHQVDHTLIPVKSKDKQINFCNLQCSELGHWQQTTPLQTVYPWVSSLLFEM